MYFDGSGRPLTLGKELGQGAAAIVYSHGMHSGKAVKVFKPHYLQNEKTLAKRLDLLQKLALQANLSIQLGNQIRGVGSWPQEIVKNRNGVAVGFVMDTFRDGISLQEIVDAKDIKKAFYKVSVKDPNNYLKWRNNFFYTTGRIKNRVILCHNLALYFDKIYNLKAKDGRSIALDICNFDIKPKNILVTIDSDHIVPFILDLDNLTLKNNTGIVAPSHPQMTPEYSAPEGPKDKYYDYFSLAVIFYQLIINCHPFAVYGGTRFTDGTTTEFMVKKMCFAWGRNRKFLTPESQNCMVHGNFRFLPTDVQNLFVRAFDSDIPKNRPTPAEWVAALRGYLTKSGAMINSQFKMPV
jgi:DNA-binding helix-hairpin-helix protein with protein kinase domain